MPNPAANPVDEARRINRTWFVRGHLAEDAAGFLDALENRDPALLRDACERAVAAARRASKEMRDPKPDFYAALFLHATPDEAARFLPGHSWTRRVVEQ